NQRSRFCRSGPARRSRYAQTSRWPRRCLLSAGKANRASLRTRSEPRSSKATRRTTAAECGKTPACHVYRRHFRNDATLGRASRSTRKKGSRQIRLNAPSCLLFSIMEVSNHSAEVLGSNPKEIEHESHKESREPLFANYCRCSP